MTQSKLAALNKPLRRYYEVTLRFRAPTGEEEDKLRRAVAGVDVAPPHLLYTERGVIAVGNMEEFNRAVASMYRSHAPLEPEEL